MMVHDDICYDVVYVCYYIPTVVNTQCTKYILICIWKKFSANVLQQKRIYYLLLLLHKQQDLKSDYTNVNTHYKQQFTQQQHISVLSHLLVELVYVALFKCVNCIIYSYQSSKKSTVRTLLSIFLARPRLCQTELDDADHKKLNKYWPRMTTNDNIHYFIHKTCMCFTVNVNVQATEAIQVIGCFDSEPSVSKC